MSMITYANKETLNAQPSIADKNKCTANDMNEIKSVVNANYGEVGDISNLNTTDKTSVVNAVNEINLGANFTTSETKTYMRYGGKPVYTKTFTFSPMPNNSSTEFNTNIANLEALFIDKNFSYFSWGGNRKYGIDNYSKNNISCWVNNSNKIEVNSVRTDGANWFLKATVLYTKTTD